MKGSPNLEIQKAAIGFAPLFFAIIGDASYCLLEEEISPLIRSARVSIRNDLAKICGSVICLLSGSCSVQFVARNADNEKEKEEHVGANYKLICHACKEGRATILFLNIGIVSSLLSGIAFLI